MTETRKDAGPARQRPRPAAVRRAAATAPAPSARPAGIAPILDADTAQLKAREGPFKGMISNPWVRQWASGAQEGTPAAEPAPAAEQTRVTGPQRISSDAGPAPEAAHGEAPEPG